MNVNAILHLLHLARRRRQRGNRKQRFPHTIGTVDGKQIAEYRNYKHFISTILFAIHLTTRSYRQILLARGPTLMLKFTMPVN